MTMKIQPLLHALIFAIVVQVLAYLVCDSVLDVGKTFLIRWNLSLVLLTLVATQFAVVGHNLQTGNVSPVFTRPRTGRALFALSSLIVLGVMPALLWFAWVCFTRPEAVTVKRSAR
ncbi:MAG: hypothetical protein H0W72_09270 [Planctomycetes bacterium]|nr:hypothetical protein [Planctomycetota bacterium]